MYIYMSVSRSHDLRPGPVQTPGYRGIGIVALNPANYARSALRIRLIENRHNPMPFAACRLTSVLKKFHLRIFLSFL